MWYFERRNARREGPGAMTRARRKQRDLRVDVPPRPSLLSRRGWTALGVYASIVLLALLVGSWKDLPLFRMPERATPDHSISFALGLVVALCTILATRWAVPRVGWFQSLHRDFRDLLGPLQRREIAIFAVSSGIAEELLFRGALVPLLGVIFSSLLFGLVHVAPHPPRWVWPAWAAVMGVIFAGLFAATGSLVGPMVAHVLINLVNLDYIDRFDPGPPKGLDSVGVEGKSEEAGLGPMAPGRNRSS